jgi:hypothetical protein
VSWFVNDRLVDGLLLETTNHHVVTNRLDVSSVTREHLNTTYKCQASNTKLRTPVEKTVRLELYREYCNIQGVYKCLPAHRWIKGRNYDPTFS